METKICCRCSYPKDISEFKLIHQKKVLKTTGILMVYHSLNCWCKACEKEYYRLRKKNNPEIFIKAQLKYLSTPKGKAMSAKHSKRHKNLYRKQHSEQQAKSARKASATCSYSYVKRLCTLRAISAGDTDYIFNEEIWQKESIILQTNRRLKEVKKQLNLK